MDVNNQGLNLPSNLQNLDVRNELLSKEVGSGPSCAYSLRDLTGSNKKAVRVRREPHDTTSAINDERDFGAQEVQAGYVEDWVNGKLENTLPCDVDTASAGYSLRKVKASYNDNAVRIRRPADNIEVDVGFDTSGAVSASSPITDGGTELTPNPDEDLGSTSTTTLNDFLNEKLTVGVAVEGGIDSSSRPDSFTNATNSSFTASVTDTAGGYFPYKTGFGDAVTVSFDLVLSGGASPSINTSLGVNTVTTRASGQGYNSSGSYTHTLNCNAEADHIRFADSDDGTFSVTNFKIVSHTHQAFVHTWYDQAGSNNAVQTTASKQPKIAESGALLADGILFDDSDDFLQSSTQVLTGTTNNSIYCVVKTLADNGYVAGSAGDGVGMSIYAGTTKFILSNNNTAGTSTQDTIPMVNDKTVLVSANFDDGTTDSLHLNANANGYANGSSAYSITAGTKFTIGARDGSTSEAVMYKGSIQEIIAYDSFQGANRFKIESNINNYYGLYNDENEFSGNPTAEVTPSAITLSNVSKTGFTAVISATSGTKQINFPLTHSLASGDDCFVSFDYTSTSTSTVGVKPRTSSLGSASNDVISATSSKFYGGTGDTSHNGFDINATATVLSFQTTAQDFTFTVSNLKVSRIARKGFVETWYDQSDNGNNATQASANQQPAIVQNGGMCKSNGSPSVLFTGDTRDDELDFTDLTLTNATIFTVVDIDSSADQQIILGGSSSTSTGTMMPMMDNASSSTQVYKNSTVGGAEQGNSQFKNGTQITLADRDDAFDNLAVDSQILFTMVDVDVAEAKVIDGISRPPSDAQTFHLQGQMNELIIYNSDLSSERGTIESEIANFYNITLS